MKSKRGLGQVCTRPCSSPRGHQQGALFALVHVSSGGHYHPINLQSFPFNLLANRIKTRVKCGPVPGAVFYK